MKALKAMSRAVLARKHVFDDDGTPPEADDVFLGLSSVNHDARLVKSTECAR